MRSAEASTGGICSNGCARIRRFCMASWLYSVGYLRQRRGSCRNGYGASWRGPLGRRPRRWTRAVITRICWTGGPGSVPQWCVSNMIIGTMNHPARDVIGEIEWMAHLGLEFIDLTLEPPCAACGMVNPTAIRAALRRHGMKVVGHTPFYLPLASAIEEVRLAAVEQLRCCLDVFQQVGASWMN